MVERLFNTEEAARFNSCSAYHSSRPKTLNGKARELLFLSHCVPNPPDKGEKIRAYHLLDQLLRHYRFHVVCFARNPADVAHARALEGRCESVYVELLPGKAALLKAGMGFVKGGSLTTTYYSSRRLEEHLKRFENAGIAAAVVFSSAMASYAPEGIPLLVDMVDVDSEKWSQYGELRWPGFLYRREAARLREVERRFAMRASCTFLTTEQERRILEKIAPGSRVRAIENGVDFDFFNPERCGAAEPAGAAYVAFVGVMDYFPNADACCWFAGQVMPELVRRVPGVEFWIVGRNPSRAVARLCERQGIRVVGGVPDVRPYVAGARAVVAPLRIARGVQNKVLEALAMGKPVLASDAVCRSFGGVPEGVIRCQTAEDYLKAVEKLAPEPAPQWHESIRNSARERFQWENNMQAFLSELESVIGGQG